MVQDSVTSSAVGSHLGSDLAVRSVEDWQMVSDSVKCSVPVTQ